MKYFLITIISFLLILIICILVTKISIQNFNNTNFKNSTKQIDIINYTYNEIDNLDPGPIKLSFNIIPNSSLKINKIVNFNIDNNGKGYLSLLDLFTSGENLNNKIAKCIENANIKYNFFTKSNINNYFSDSRFCKPNLSICNCTDNLEQNNVITITNLIIDFGRGNSYVNNLNNGISTSNLGDSWGNPIYFELGGNRLNLPKIINGELIQDISKLSNKNFGLFNSVKINLFDNNYGIQFNNVKFVGEGQGTTSIRGSCIFIIYNLNKTSTSYGDGWFSASSYILSPARRLIIENFLWSGHVGFYTDYENFSNYSNFKQDNINIGSNIYIPNYKILEDNNCLRDNVIMQGEVEILIINVWVELQENTIGGAIIPQLYLLYPLLSISNSSIQRIYMSNITVFSYQNFNNDCLGLVFLNSGFLNQKSQFPADIFLQQCSFASRNTNVSTQELDATDAISFYINNGDKISIVNSTFHGGIKIEANKLAMFNCYCLHVGNTLLQDVDTDFTIANPAIIYKESKNSNSSGSGFKDSLRTSSRIIFQNIIFVIHLSKKNLINEKIKGNTLEEIYNNGNFKVGGNYDYFSKKTIYPFYIDTSTSKNDLTKLTNFFMQNCVYYGIIIDDTQNKAGKCPFSNNITQFNKCPLNNNLLSVKDNSTFSAINLTNIKNAYIDNFTINQNKLGNIL